MVLFVKRTPSRNVLSSNRTTPAKIQSTYFLPNEILIRLSGFDLHLYSESTNLFSFTEGCSGKKKILKRNGYINTESEDLLGISTGEQLGLDEKAF